METASQASSDDVMDLTTESGQTVVARVEVDEVESGFGNEVKSSRKYSRSPTLFQNFSKSWDEILAEIINNVRTKLNCLKVIRSAKVNEVAKCHTLKICAAEGALPDA
ncbi:hypothetical protein Tco_0770894 [Tanacetum coccineum]|uniref:Uncharacterized protein n=1 Tax=Tanacetum coccineum TaxID=301880 RepID=A0ABQ4ZDG9_9ASTR